jgi:hypothetical protein
MKPTIQRLTNQWVKVAFLLCITGITFSSCSTSNDDNEPAMVEYSGDIIPSNNEVTTSATGSATAIYNPENHEVTFEVMWQGLSTPVIAMHFHDDGPVIHDIEGWEAETSGSVSGMVTFSADEAADLAAGDVYVQIHTEDYPGGEVVSPLAKDENVNNDTPPNGDY